MVSNGDDVTIGIKLVVTFLTMSIDLRLVTEGRISKLLECSNVGTLAPPRNLTDVGWESKCVVSCRNPPPKGLALVTANLTLRVRS